jgi:hypothetical protein
MQGTQIPFLSGMCNPRQPFTHTRNEIRSPVRIRKFVPLHSLKYATTHLHNPATRPWLFICYRLSYRADTSHHRPRSSQLIQCSVTSCSFRTITNALA